MAAVISAGYAATGAVVVASRRRAAADAKAFAAALAAIGAVAADLRAGGDPLVALARVQPALEPTAASSMSKRVRAALRVADDTGAPLAELLDRLETDGHARPGPVGGNRHRHRGHRRPRGFWLRCRRPGSRWARASVPTRWGFSCGHRLARPVPAVP